MNACYHRDPHTEKHDIPTTTAQRVKAAGFTHVLTYGGPVPVDDWQPYNQSPEDVACTFELDGDTLREIPNDPNRATVGGLLVTGLWRLVRLDASARNDRGMRCSPSDTSKALLSRHHQRRYRAARKTGASLILAAFLSLPAFAAEPCRINVNAASPAQLQLFARTGPVLAGKLASGRPYKALNDVDAVKGIGPAWLAVNGPHVAFSGATTCTAKIPTPKTPKVVAPSPLP